MGQLNIASFMSSFLCSNCAMQFYNIWICNQLNVHEVGKWKEYKWVHSPSPLQFLLNLLVLFCFIPLFNLYWKIWNGDLKFSKQKIFMKAEWTRCYDQNDPGLMINIKGIYRIDKINLYANDFVYGSCFEKNFPIFIHEQFEPTKPPTALVQS